MRIVPNSRGARLVQGRSTVSYVLKEPGPTHSVFDVLAAAAWLYAPGPRVLMLGFAGGGTVAALRALGHTGPVDAVDLSREGTDLFWKFAKRWAGQVRVEQEEAAGWLRREKRRWDAVIEDLTIQEGEVHKAPVALDPLPELVPKHLHPQGISIWNALPVEGVGWDEYVARTALHAPAVRVVTFEGFTNRVILCASELPPAERLSRALREELERIGSDQAGRFHVRTWKRG